MEDNLHIVIVGELSGPDSKLLWDFLADADLSRVVSVANVNWGTGTPELVLVVREDGSDIFDLVYGEFMRGLRETKRPITKHLISRMMSVDQLHDQAIRLRGMLENLFVSLNGEMHEGEAEEVQEALPSELEAGGSE